MDIQLQLDLLDSFLLEKQEKAINAFKPDTTENEFRNFRTALKQLRSQNDGGGTVPFMQNEIDELKQEKEFLMQTVNSFNKLINK